jgi:hypothetical protein
LPGDSRFTPELQKQRQQLDDRQRTNDEQKKTIAQQQREIQALATRLAKLEALLAPQH